MNQVEMTHDGHAGTLVVDGHDMSRSVGADMTVTFRPHLAPRVDLYLTRAAYEFEGEAEVAVAPATADALVALGWTAPSEDGGSVA